MPKLILAEYLTGVVPFESVWLKKGDFVYCIVHFIYSMSTKKRPTSMMA